MKPSEETIKPRFRIQSNGLLVCVNVEAINEVLKKDEFGMYIHADNYILMRTMINFK